jgi:hypothetical protein
MRQSAPRRFDGRKLLPRRHLQDREIVRVVTAQLRQCVFNLYGRLLFVESMISESEGLWIPARAVLLQQKYARTLNEVVMVSHR